MKIKQNNNNKKKKETQSRLIIKRVMGSAKIIIIRVRFEREFRWNNKKS